MTLHVLPTLKTKNDALLSGTAFKCNLRHYTVVVSVDLLSLGRAVVTEASMHAREGVVGRCSSGDPSLTLLASNA